MRHFFGLLFHIIRINYCLVNINEQEKALLEGLAANESDAIETIYKENYMIIQSFIIKNNGYPEDARDIFQEAMIILFEKAKLNSFELS